MISKFQILYCNGYPFSISPLVDLIHVILISPTIQFQAIDITYKHHKMSNFLRVLPSEQIMRRTFRMLFNAIAICNKKLPSDNALETISLKSRKFQKCIHLHYVTLHCFIHDIHIHIRHICVQAKCFIGH